MLRLGGLLVVFASLLAAGCSIDRIEWESTGFVVEGVTRELEEEHHLQHPVVECIKREVGGAWWECRAHEGEAEYRCKVEAGLREVIHDIECEREESEHGEPAETEPAAADEETAQE
jgi:hypothetical protein